MARRPAFIAVLYLLLAAAGCVQDGGDGAASGDAALPQEVAEVVAAECLECHGPEPRFGAPMSLARADDFHRPASSDPTRSVAELVRLRVLDPQRPMPPAPFAALQGESQRRLLDWIDAGAPAAEASVRAGAPAPWVVTVLPPEPRQQPEQPADDGCERELILRAHGRAEPGDSEPHRLSGPTDTVECFVFAAPADAPVSARSIEPLIDDARVVHHLGLSAVVPAGDRTFDGKIGCELDQDLPLHAIHVWTPGSGALSLPEGVGLRLPHGPGAFYRLDVHYSSLLSEAADRSGYRICGSATPALQQATMHVLTSDDILVQPGATYETGVDCMVQGEEPVHVVNLLPHMHMLGRRMTVERIFADGRAPEMLHDRPYSFVNQTAYPTEWVLPPGEGLRTTCHYENPTPVPVGFGLYSVAEMCTAFVVAYPSGRLTDPSNPWLPDGCWHTVPR